MDLYLTNKDSWVMRCIGYESPIRFSQTDSGLSWRFREVTATEALEWIEANGGLNVEELGERVARLLDLGEIDDLPENIGPTISPTAGASSEEGGGRFTASAHSYAASVVWRDSNRPDILDSVATIS